MGALTPGTVLGGCRIDAVVGRGGMGIVYRARQLDLDRDVAVKVIAPELLEDSKSRKRFLTEARAAGAVEHPNVVPIHGTGVADGCAYLVMRYVAGDDLRTLVRRDGVLAPDRAAWVVLQLGEALDAIHEAGYVHRDVKPQNVMIDADGHVYLSDFGLAKHALATAGPTTSEQWVGTLDYVAPEQIRGERVDARADVYALGGVLYFVLTGRVPFERDSDHAKLWAHLVDEPPRPSTVRPGLPAALDAVVARALAKDPADRQQSAGDLGRAAQAAVGSDPLPRRDTAAAETVATVVQRNGPDPGRGATTTTPSPPALLPARVPPRRRGLAVGALAAGAGIAVLGLWLVPDRGGGQRAPPQARSAHAAATPKPAARPAGARVGATIRNVGRRPRGVVVAGGAVWVLSIHEPRITRLDVHSGRRVGEQPYVGRGAAGIAADHGMVWVAKRATSAILGLDRDSAKRLRRFDTPGPPARIAAGPSGLWVVARETDGGPATLLHYDRAGERLLGRSEFPDGIAAIALGAGATWVALVRTRQVVRVVPGEPADHAWLTEPASDLAFGAGHVWASVPDDDSVARIDPTTLLAVTTDLGPRPAGLAVAGGRVYVASNTRHTVDVLEARRVRRGPVQRVRVPPNPYAVGAGGGHVWVAGVGAGTLTRIDDPRALP